jgi:hypothetical protein
MPDDTHAVIKRITVTCYTDGCYNEGVEIDVDAVVGGQVQCGPCGTIIVGEVE